MYIAEYVIQRYQNCEQKVLELDSAHIDPDSVLKMHLKALMRTPLVFSNSHSPLPSACLTFQPFPLHLVPK